jgi:hypothetical protein
MIKLTKKQIDKIRRIQEKKAWKIVREKVLERDNYTCIWCGKKDKEEYVGKDGKKKTVHLNACHLLPKEFKIFETLKYDVKNLVAGCSNCHKYGVFSFHRNPIYSLEVVKRKYINNYKYILTKLDELKQEYDRLQ